jgi:hypothetical protein
LTQDVCLDVRTVIQAATVAHPLRAGCGEARARISALMHELSAGLRLPRKGGSTGVDREMHAAQRKQEPRNRTGGLLAVLSLRRLA